MVPIDVALFRSIARWWLCGLFERASSQATKVFFFSADIVFEGKALETTQVLNAKEAIAKHVHWKIALRFAITMEEQLTPEQVSAIQHHRQCAIGHWLDSSVNFTMRQHPAYRDLVTHHMQFHREMIAISRLIAEKRFYEADASMNESSRFAQAGLALARAITAFDRIAKVAVPVCF